MDLTDRSKCTQLSFRRKAYYSKVTSKYRNWNIQNK